MKQRSSIFGTEKSLAAKKFCRQYLKISGKMPNYRQGGIGWFLKLKRLVKLPVWSGNSCAPTENPA
jgi:hypothetical protein